MFSFFCWQGLRIGDVNMLGVKDLGTRLGRVILTAGLVLGASLGLNPAMGANAVDEDADKILRSMATYLEGVSSFSANADIDAEVIDLTGHKLQLSSRGSVLIERPGRMYLTREGGLVNVEVFFDGKIVTVNSKSLNVFAQFESPGTIDDALRTARFETGLDAPGADLLYADLYSGLIAGVTGGRHLGMAYVNGIESHHLAFRGPQVDWQIWIQAGDTPLPMKYIITSKWMTGAPQYSLRFRDWNLEPRIDAARFEFTAPNGAKKLDTIPLNAMGEIAIEEIQ